VQPRQSRPQPPLNRACLPRTCLASPSRALAPTRKANFLAFSQNYTQTRPNCTALPSRSESAKGRTPKRCAAAHTPRARNSAAVSDSRHDGAVRDASGGADYSGWSSDLGDCSPAAAEAAFDAACSLAADLVAKGGVATAKVRGQGGLRAWVATRGGGGGAMAALLRTAIARQVAPQGLGGGPDLVGYRSPDGTSGTLQGVGVYASLALPDTTLRPLQGWAPQPCVTSLHLPNCHPCPCHILCSCPLSCLAAHEPLPGGLRLLDAAAARLGDTLSPQGESRREQGRTAQRHGRSGPPA
jgi:hypothetical protein